LAAASGVAISIVIFIAGVSILGRLNAGWGPAQSEQCFPRQGG